LFAVAAALTALTVSVAAQKTTPVHPGKGGSPHVRTEWAIDGANISIEYGRPSVKGRPENQLMPPGKEWRTGADEPTTLKTDKPLKFGTLSVPAGSYMINTVPGATEWQLIVSNSKQTWGIPYQAGQDLGRVPMKVTKTPAPVEMLTISIDDTAAGATLRIEWGSTRASVDFTVG
jgi:hypothetical protein